MPTLIKLAEDGAAHWAEDAFVFVTDEEDVPTQGDVVVSLKRFIAEGDALSAGRKVGVLIQPDESVEDLAYDLPRLAVVALTFPKYRDGRAYSSARLLRERYKYAGEIRAVGDVLREQAQHMVRCGFDAFEPADGSDPEAWLKAAHRYRHVYQRAADTRPSVWDERRTQGV
jgi:uncharacterized protein (DUF934 family)